MAFKRILILLRGYPEPPPTGSIEAAIDVAVTLDARISALSCAILPHVPKSLLSGVVPDVSALAQEERQRIARSALQLLRNFSELARQRNVLGQELYRKCAPSDVPPLLAGHARLSDSHWYLETALFESGRPVLVLPHGHRSPGAGAFGTVVVAWDNTRAAARAIADALPILRQAKSVRVVTIVNEKAIAKDPPLVEVVSHLAAHGVCATHDAVNAGGWDAGTAIVSYLRKHSGDLLVMGGYGHSRLREFILGGATKHMLTHPPVPVLMAH